MIQRVFCCWNVYTCWIGSLLGGQKAINLPRENWKYLMETGTICVQVLSKDLAYLKGFIALTEIYGHQVDSWNKLKIATVILDII